MSRVLPLIVLGITLFVGGLYWMLWNDSTTYLDNLVINDAYYTLASFIWRMIPAVLLIVGLLCVIMAGVNATRNNEVYR